MPFDATEAPVSAPTTTVNVEALLQLKRVIRDAPDGLWDMRCIGSARGCGTVHCAWGWAACDPWFRLHKINFRACPTSRVTLSTFGISEHQASQLFAMSYSSYTYNALHYYRIPKQEVLDNIDRLIAGQSMVKYGSRMINDGTANNI